MGSPVWRGQGLPSALAINESSCLCVGSMGMLHIWYWLCSGGQSALLPTSWCKQHGPHSLHELLPALLLRWGWANSLHSEWGKIQFLCLGVDKSGSRANKTSRIKIRLVWTPLSSLVRVYPRLGSTDEQAAGCCLGLLFGHYRYELSLP